MDTATKRTLADEWSPFVGVIYGVREMGSSEYRYVGLTTHRISRRKSEHYKTAMTGRKTPFADWLRQRTDRASVYFESLELVMGSDREALGRAEVRWIEKFRRDGHRLLNLNDGGLGNHGYVWTEEQRKAAGDRARGRPTGVSLKGPDSPNWGRHIHSEGQRRRWSEMRRGQGAGPENVNYGKFGSDHPSFGHRLSPETKARLSEMRSGEKNPNFGKSASAETRAKRSAALKGRPMPSSVRNAHTRYHTNKGVFKNTCRHCIDDQQMAEPRENES
jgi:hypothetical protein